MNKFFNVIKQADAERCKRENANAGWPVREPLDGWYRRPDGSLIKDGDVRPVRSVPTTPAPHKRK